MEISKAQMELAIRDLERRAEKIEDVPTFRRITVTTEHFDAEHLAMLCSLFADEWGKARDLNNSLLESSLGREISSAYYTAKARNFLQEAITKEDKPSFRRKIWHRKPGGIFWFLCMALPVMFWLVWLVLVLLKGSD